MSRRVKVASGLNLIFGSWLIIAPFVLGYTDLAARWNSIIVGAVVVVLTWMRVANPTSGSRMSSVNAILGLWLIISAFVFGFSGTGSAWNEIVTGLAICIFGVWSANSRYSHPAQ